VLTLDEPLQLRLVDPGGRRVVLGTPLPRGADPHHPGGRASTHLVVADVTTGSTRAYDVPRNVEPEAFGVGIPTLFVIDHRPADDPVYYRVAAMDLRDGSVAQLIGPDKHPLDEDMAGTARQQVYSAAGNQLYTLYAQPKDADVAANVPMESFVHVLDLRNAWAYCVDLPDTFGRGSARTAGISLDGSGTKLYVVDTHARKVVVMDTRDLDTSALATHEPPTRVRALPRAVRRDAAVFLVPTATAVSLTTETGRVVFSA
jgi:hypothetical protein